MSNPSLINRRNFLKAAAIAAGATALPAVLATPASAATIFAQYNFDGNANDSSGGGRNGTLNNGPTFITGRIGQAVDLNGSNQYVSLPAGIVNSLSNFSIAAWVKLDTTSGWRRIFDFGAGTSVYMFLTPSNGSVIRFAITTGGSGAEQRIDGTAALPTGTWKHVAVTKNGNTGILYVDGVQVGQNTNMTLGPNSLGNTNNNWIGRSQYADPYLDGQIDDFRIYNGALTAAEVQSLFGGGGPTNTPTRTPTLGSVTNTPTRTPTQGSVTNTPTRTNTPSAATNTPTLTPTPSASGLWAQYNFDGNANDSSGGGRNGTLNNGPTFVAGRIGQAVDLNGSNQYVSLPAGVVNSLSNFSIAAWVKLDTTSGWRRIFDFGTGTSVYMFLTPSNGSVVRFAITTGGSGAEQRIDGAAALPTGTWKHVAVTKNGNTGVLYVDGVQVGQNTNMTLGPNSLGNTNNNWIGRSQYADPYLDGQIDDFRLYNRALSASEVYSLFNPGGATPTPTRTPTRTNTPGTTFTPTPTPTGLIQKAYRVFWVRPTDVAYDQNIVTGIGNVMLEAQRYYQSELGKTFRFNPVEVLNGTQTANWYATNPNGPDPYWYCASNLRDVIKQQTGIVENDSRWKVVGYISAEGNGGASHQWVFLPKHDTDGAAGYRPEPMGRWYGGMVHELGHAFTLPDATSTDGTPMSASFYDYPNCHFNDSQKNQLLTRSENSGYWV